MKLALLGCLIVVAASGCLGDNSFFGGSDCKYDQSRTLYLGPDLSLQDELHPAGSTPGNGFNEAFLTNDLDEWIGAPVTRGYAITGDIEVEYWSQGNNMPAPIVGDDPTEGYHFFNQIGTNRGFIESFVVEYNNTLGDTEIRHHLHQYPTPAGGLVMEPGDNLRLLLTNLVANDAGGAGPTILWGGETPSAVKFTQRCVVARDYADSDIYAAEIVLPAHRGLLTGLVPTQEGVNQQSVPFQLAADTDRLTITLEAEAIPGAPKSDMDLSIENLHGEHVWSIGSPYTDEIGTRWAVNLRESMPPGDYVAKVNSYSGHAYQGVLTIYQEVIV